MTIIEDELIHPLIEPYGIEIRCGSPLCRFSVDPLIEPYGIEIQLGQATELPPRIL